MRRELLINLALQMRFLRLHCICGLQRCWLENSALKTWALEQGLHNATAVLDYFHIRWQRALLKQNRFPQFWDEFFWVRQSV